MNLKKFLPFVIVIIFLIIISCFLFIKNIFFNKNFEGNNINYVKIAEQILKVDLALTPKSQEQGLSGRDSLKEDEGMLFVFEKKGKYSFWMKDMNFPIDIIWIGKDLRVIYIKKNAQPESFPETFGADQDANFVLEVISGFSEKNNLKEGDNVKFLP
ncbi:MAG: DUF192 domain-containing protein [Minisyncoccia bacterium]